MKIQCKSKVRYRVIDFLNSQSWLVSAAAITLCGIALLWTMGLITLHFAS
jgi:hypothetical protein